jgi:hypothetical protein
MKRARRFVFCIALLQSACANAPPAGSAAPELDQQPAAQALPVMVQQLLDALPHDASVWQGYLSERALYVDESGEVATKAELLEGFGPFPPGLSGSIAVRNPRVTESGEVATIVFDAHERQKVYDQDIEVDYLGSEVWQREAGRWRMLLAHTSVRARDPAPQAVPVKRLRGYAGVYELGGTRRYQVEVRGGELFGGAPGSELKRLIAVGDNVFAEAGNPLGVLRVFVRGRDGKVVHLVQRRKFADLVWKRV